MKWFFAVSLCVLFPLSVFGDEFNTERLDNWHQWRGPEANGFAPHADPPLEWDKDTNIKWKVEVPGDGDATPIVWGDRIFILTAIKTDREEESPPKEIAEAPGGNPFHVDRPTHYYKFVVMCFDRRTGDVVWGRVATELVPHEGHHRDHGFASASPVTDGRYVYASFGSRGIYCYDIDGNLQWQRDLGDMSIYRFFGEAISPVLYKDTLIVNWDHEGDSFLYALDARTGETKWKVARDEHTSWATPLVVEHDGTTQIVVNAFGKTRGYAFDSGEVIWECKGQVRAVIPCPVAYQGVVFCMSGYPGSALLAISLDATGDVSDSEKVVWSRKRDAPYCPSALLYQDRLYFNKGNGGILSVLDASTGEPIIKATRMPGIRGVYASPVAVEGKIYFTSRDGTTLVIDDGPKLNVLATNKLDEPTSASPALVGKDLFLRSEKHLFRISDE